MDFQYPTGFMLWKSRVAKSWSGQWKRDIYLLFISLPYFACTYIWFMCMVLQLHGSPQDSNLVWITWEQFFTVPVTSAQQYFGLNSELSMFLFYSSIIYWFRKDSGHLAGGISLGSSEWAVEVCEWAAWVNEWVFVFEEGK